MQLKSYDYVVVVVVVVKSKQWIDDISMEMAFTFMTD